MSSSMQNMKTTTMTWHTSTALIRSFLPMSRKNIITIMTRKGSTIATAMKTVNTITIMMKKASTTATAMKTVKNIIITTIMMRKNTIARTSMARKDTIITTITNTAIWRMSWRSLTALP